MTGTGQSDQNRTDDSGSAPPLPPVAQEKTDGPMDSAEFAERLDVDPQRDDVKG